MEKLILDLNTNYSVLTTNITNKTGKTVLDFVKSCVNPYNRIDEAVSQNLENGCCLDLNELGFVLLCWDDDGVMEFFDNYQKGKNTDSEFVYYPLGKTTQDVRNWLLNGCPQITAQRAESWAF